jgi:hypothetical protein
MKKSTVAFADLRQLLIDLDFKNARTDRGFWAFEHKPSDTIFVFRPYRPGDRVSLHDLDTVRRHLDYRGLLAENTFDNLVKKATA